MDETRLVVLHIGPIQDFIASARRSRDLWFGSWLLSELSKAAALEIVNQHGGEVGCLVFPAAKSRVELESPEFCVANKIVALVIKSPNDLDRPVRDAVIKRLQEIRNEAYGKVKGTFDRQVANDQVEDMLEFFWAACPVEGNYEKARARAEALLAARKVTRNFRRVTWGKDVPKSSLDGERESVILESVYDTMTPEQLRKSYRVRPGERLCGVGLLKRHGKRGSGEDRFFSTSHVAALPLLDRLKKDDDATNEHIKTYTDALMSLGIPENELGNVPSPHDVFGRYDGHILFEERLKDYLDDEAELKKAKDALKEFRKEALDGKAPIPYYALLLADGDGMGKAIHAQETKDEHRALSQALIGFAAAVRGIVDDHKGSLVYSGGDDVLAFVPLHTVLACSRCLAEALAREMAASKLFADGQESPTLSAGIVVAHHLDPLSDTIELARQAEWAAKSVDGKNALAVTLSKRSGTDRTVKGEWGTLDQRLHGFIALHRSNAIPDGAAYELLDLALRLRPREADPLPTDLEEPLRLEAVRILRRKKSRQDQEQIPEDVRRKLEGHIQTDGVSVRQLADELIIAHEFALAEKLAETPLETKEGEEQ